MLYGEVIVHMVDAQVVRNDTEDGLRTHLGASVLGNKCMRSVWFAFHWTDREEFDGRMLRLFARGQNSEATFANLLRELGATVWTEDADGKQFRISAFGGHLGGSMDGVAQNLPNLPDGLDPNTPILLEMKTHNAKSFSKLQSEGLEKSKPQHYKQAQLYMHKGGLKYCLYMAVNKDTDKLWCYFFQHDPVLGDSLVNRGESIIFGEGLPPRISEHASWYECRFCSFAGVCHGTKMPFVNCRTCLHASPQRDGSWRCKRGKAEIRSSPKQGCGEHLFNPYLFPRLGAAIGKSDALGPVSIHYTLRTGTVVTNGHNAFASKDLDLIG